MKWLLLLFLSVVSCSAGEMVKVVDADFKRLDPEQASKLAELCAKLDISKPEDRDYLERLEQQYYAQPMMEVSAPYFRHTRLRTGDDWRAIWKTREAEALADCGSDRESREALKEAFVHLQRFEDPRDAHILERVVRANFGGEPTWILLVHWEREDAVQQDLRSGKEAVLGHFLVIGVRCSDRKLVSRLWCG